MNIYFKTLVLNADYKPLSYFPLSVWDWKDTIKAVFLEKVSVVSEYNEIARSPSLSIKIPSVNNNLFLNSVALPRAPKFILLANFSTAVAII